MFWLPVLGLVAAWAIIILVWACCMAAKEEEEAFEELNESIRQLRQVTQSLARTSGRGAELVRRRARPIRHMLEEMGEETTQPQRR